MCLQKNAPNSSLLTFEFEKTVIAYHAVGSVTLGLTRESTYFVCREWKMGHPHCGRKLLQHLTNWASNGYRSGAGSDLGLGHTELPWNSMVRGVRYNKTKRKLECILTADIDKLGKAGESVKVAPGYFRNHLMPKSLALPNLDKYAYLIRHQQQIYQRPKEEKKEEVVERTGDQMDEYKTAGLRRIVLNYGKELRYPVTKEEVLDEVKRQLRVSLEAGNLVMPANLTMCGEYEIPLRLPKVIPLPDGKTNISLKIKIQRK
uniref:Large ribosomal subunit protein bL9c n=1 Tax=Araucaria cunninghamii TaxID=56994 RepID=A0A0D6R572_ARACU